MDLDVLEVAVFFVFELKKEDDVDSFKKCSICELMLIINVF